MFTCIANLQAFLLLVSTMLKDRTQHETFFFVGIEGKNVKITANVEWTISPVLLSRLDNKNKIFWIQNASSHIRYVMLGTYQKKNANFFSSLFFILRPCLISVCYDLLFFYLRKWVETIVFLKLWSIQCGRNCLTISHQRYQGFIAAAKEHSICNIFCLLR